MLPFSAEEFVIEDAIQSGRTQFQPRLKRLAINGLGKNCADVGERNTRRGNELLGVDGVSGRNLRTKTPAIKMQWQGQRRVQIKATDQRRRPESRLTSRKAFYVKIERPVERCLP